MTELDTMYRVMILYMLNLVEYPLTNTQITNFVLEKEYTNYFTVPRSDHQSSADRSDHCLNPPITIPAIT